MWVQISDLLDGSLAWRRLGDPVPGEVFTLPACLRGAEVLAMSWGSEEHDDRAGCTRRQVVYYARLPRDPYRCHRRIVALRVQLTEYAEGITSSCAYLAELPRHIAQQLGLVA